MPKTESMALVEPTSMALESWTDFADMEDGSEEVAPQFPYIKIVQATSGMEGAGKHGGEFWRSDTEEYVAALDIVPLFMKETRAHFLEGDPQPVCISGDGKVPLSNQRLWTGQYEDLLIDANWIPAGSALPPDAMVQQPSVCGICPFSQWGADGATPHCGNSLVILCDLDGELVQLRISGKSIKPWRSFVGRLVTAKKRPLCSYRVNLYTEAKQEGASKRWYELRVQAEALTPQEALPYRAVINHERGRFERAVIEDHVQDDGPRNVTPADAGWTSDSEFGGRASPNF